MPQCMAFKSTGERCGRRGDDRDGEFIQHLQYCTTHWAVYQRRVDVRTRHGNIDGAAHHIDGRCHAWVGSRRWCNAPLLGDMLLCHRHIEANRVKIERAEEERNFDQRARVRLIWLTGHNPAFTWRRAIEILFQLEEELGNNRLYRIAVNYFNLRADLEPGFDQRWQLDAYFRWVSLGGVNPPPDLVNLVVPPPPRVDRNRLDVIARDPQSVHTRAVSDQTNKGLEKLLEAAAASVPRRSPEWFAARWLVRGYGHWAIVTRVVNDMKHWYDMPFCKVDNDWLFRRALDGLYISIKKFETAEQQSELFKRAFEECLESVGMCCEGHISRLCNVMVGFDDAFVPPVPFGEILQSKMAAISNMDIETEEKIRQATAFFNEFAVPEADRSAWLDAF